MVLKEGYNISEDDSYQYELKINNEINTSREIINNSINTI
jgi:hypothetical protein